MEREGRVGRIYQGFIGLALGREAEHRDYSRHPQGRARRWWQCRWGEGWGTISKTAGKQLGGDIRQRPLVGFEQ